MQLSTAKPGAYTLINILQHVHWSVIDSSHTDMRKDRWMDATKYIISLLIDCNMVKNYGILHFIILRYSLHGATYWHLKGHFLCVAVIKHWNLLESCANNFEHFILVIDLYIHS